MGLSTETILDTVRVESSRVRGFGLLLCWLRVDGDRDEV